MPTIKPFQLIDNFKDLEEFEKHKNGMEVIKIDHSSKLKYCDVCLEKHEMKRQYGSCSNENCLKDLKWPRQYKILFCMKTSAVNVYQFGEHSGEIVKASETVKKTGCSDVVKTKIDECIKNHLVKPKHIHLKLSEEISAKLMPSLLQVQTYVKNRRNRMGNNDDIESLREYLKEFRLRSDHGDHDMFIFGCQLGDGSDEDHFHLGFTSRNLIRQIVNFSKGCYHIDATYKIVKYCYPLIVFGFSDVGHQFYPIAFMFTSHEQATDFDYFFAKLDKVCNHLDVAFKPEFIVSDASPALYNSIHRNLPDAQHLMCWFHVKLNVRKHKTLIPADKYVTVCTEINKLHSCICEASYKILLKMTLLKWSKDPQLVKFRHYFKKQWVVSKFSNWQIFSTPAGYAHTNNPVEQYNRTIKADFTDRVKYHMQPAIQVFKRLINYESKKVRTVMDAGKVTLSTRKLAEKILMTNRLINQGSKYTYRQTSGIQVNIDTGNKTCSCAHFYDKASCKHLTAACIKDSIRLHGLPQRRKKLTAVRRKQNKPKEDTDDSDEEHELIEPELEKAPEVFSMPLLPAEVSEPIIKKKRGRPTNAEKALRFEQSQAVEQPVIRLSSRLSQKHKKL